MSLSLRMGPVRVGTRSAGLRLGPLSMSHGYGRRGGGGLFGLMIALGIQTMVWMMKLMWLIIVFAIACYFWLAIGIAYVIPQTRPWAERIARANRGRLLPR